VRKKVFALALLFAGARAASAQLPPNEHWRTLHTKHFRVHFTPPVEAEARRAAVNAERAYAQLSAELVPPRGIIELVVADNVDYTNGYATPFPYNRIVIYARPPSDASGLRNYEDWNALVVTHELTHIFHLDRARGIWAFGQAIFGRNGFLFPNFYQPSWIHEGLAVYYESRLTGVGRLESSEHSMIARASALAGAVPSLQELAPGTTRYPGGGVVYIYGSLLLDYLSRTRGPGTIRDFIERGSRSLLPFFLTPLSRSAFGVSFQTAWQQWKDSLQREVRSAHEVMPGWQQLTSAGHVALFPRWLADTALLYGGDKGREVPAAYEVSLTGVEKRLGRRNSATVNLRMPDGSILFSQPEYLDPYHIRSDLFLQRDGRESRLTRGARLSAPDVRADGEIVAEQNAPATTRLVRVSRDGRVITPITPATLDVQWTDPRWSPDGSRIVAVRQTRGLSEIVILDPDGKVIDTFGATHAVNSSPSWSADGRRIFFSSERTGLPQIYVADATTFSPSVARITDAPTGVFYPELSTDESRLAAVLFKADGFHIGVAPLESAIAVNADSTHVSPRSGCLNCVSVATGLPPLGATDTSPATEYSPWRSLLPRYWLPNFEAGSDQGNSFGATTSGFDVVSRHDYTLEFLHNTRFGQSSAWLWYRYAGLGLPLLDFYATQNYSNGGILTDVGGSESRVGDLHAQERTVSLQATLTRPRFRTYTQLSFGGELETIGYSTTPDTLLSHLSPFYLTRKSYPAIVASLGWSNAQRPGLSISPEDGISLGVNGRSRWHAGTSGGSTRAVEVVGLGYKSLDFPGFAHHVLAVRAAVGLTDEGSPDLYSAGGTSGTLLQIFPGYALGSQRRTFGVRGYPAGSEGGIRAYSAAAEYRLPLFSPSRGFRWIPVFFDRASMSLFGETGRAFCPAVVPGGVCRQDNVSNPVMTSTGLELNIDSGLQLDLQARVRLGVAFPLVNREELEASRAQFYATFGSSF